jgi:hypothetical protein
MKLSPNFFLKEFTCECCGDGTPKQLLVTNLETIRFILTERYHPATVKVVISGPLRCDVHNKEVGGAKDSRHRFKHSDGVDIKAYNKLVDNWIQINPDEVAKIARSIMKDYGGVGQYKGRTHIDVRPTVANWDYR